MTIEVSAQSSVFPALVTYSAPVPAPDPPGDAFNPPMLAGTVSSAVPACAEWTRTGGPDESLVITGSNFSAYSGLEEGKDTRFVIYGKNGGIHPAKIQRLDADKAIITLSDGLPAWSMYLIWPGNEAGYGTPIAVNKTDAWWVGPNKTTKGSTVSVYGRNLSQNNDTFNSFVYLKPANGPGQWVAVTSANPYKVDFTVPSTLVNGEYEVWVHNGHGGKYGWSGPIGLTINDGINWIDTVFNVKDFGVTGNGVTDDTESINRAILAAEKVPYSTVYFPAGIYMVSNAINLKNNLRYQGENKNSTIIRCAPTFSTSALSVLYGANISNYEIVNFTIDGNANFKGSLSYPIWLRGSQNVRLNEVTFSFQGYGLLDLHLSKYVFMTNCELVGKISFLGNSSQLFIDKCHFRLTNDTELAMHTWGGIGVSLTNSTCQDFDNSNPTNGAGWGLGRFFVGNGAFGSSQFTYISQNTTTDLAPRPTGVDQNTGEQFMWEGLTTDWTGTATASTALTTTLDGFTNTLPSDHIRYAVIIRGKGLGQSRRIVAYNGNSITLDAPWNVPPDTKSQISIGNYADRIVLYKNMIDGKLAAAASPDHKASSGIQPYGGVFNFIADNNTIQEVRYGIANWATEFSGMIDPNYFSLYTANKLLNCRWALHNALTVTTAVGTGLLGVTYRYNEVKTAILSGIVNTVVSPGKVVGNSFVYEFNKISGVKNGFSTTGDEDSATGTLPTGKEVENELLYKNIITASSTSSDGYGIKTVPKIVLRENSFSGFSALYSESLFGAVIEAPYHVIEMAGQVGGEVVEEDFLLWNSGVNSLDWKASSNASWLTLSVSSGIIQDQSLHTIIKLRANPAILRAEGYYVAIITITSGTQTKNYTVIFKVTNPASVAFLNIRPNPFQEKATIEFAISENEDAILQIYNMNGVLLETQSKSPTGVDTIRRFEFDGRKYASSIYICKLTCGKTVLTKKLILIK